MQGFASHLLNVRWAKMNAADSNRLLRYLVIIASGYYFFDSLIYGAGRGMSEVPIGRGGLALLKVMMYGAVLIGALNFPLRLRIAVTFLGVGIIARSLFELNLSVAKEWIVSDLGFDLKRALLLIFQYVSTFVIPCLLLIDAIRLIRRSSQKAIQHESNESDDDAEQIP